MKLIKATPKEDEIDGIIYDESLELDSEDVETLKVNGKEIARALGYKNEEWSELYPAMGNKSFNDVKEFQMELPNGVLLQIRY